MIREVSHVCSPVTDNCPSWKSERRNEICCQTGYRTQDPWLTSRVPYRLRYAARQCYHHIVIITLWCLYMFIQYMIPSEIYICIYLYPALLIHCIYFICRIHPFHFSIKKYIIKDFSCHSCALRLVPIRDNYFKLSYYKWQWQTYKFGPKQTTFCLLRVYLSLISVYNIILKRSTSPYNLLCSSWCCPVFFMSWSVDSILVCDYVELYIYLM